MAKILEKINQLKDAFFDKKGAFKLEKQAAQKSMREIDFSDAETCKSFLQKLIASSAENHTKPFDYIFAETVNNFRGDAKTMTQLNSVVDGFKAIKNEHYEHGDVKYKKDYSEAVEKPIINLIKSCIDAVENFKDGDPKSLLLAKTGLVNLRALKRASESTDYAIGITIPGFDFRRFENPSQGLQANIEKLDSIAMSQRANSAANNLINELLPGLGQSAERPPRP